MRKVPFNVDANTAKLIGRENVPNLEGAILELVKNTYDADASVCFLYYEKETNSLYLGDNGSGMTESIILNNWMTIGGSSKQTNYKSKGGRIQTGAKGIGRFALDRIANECSLLTTSEKERFRWMIDWKQFEFGKKITEVEADLYTTDETFEDFISSITNKHLVDFIKKSFISTGSIFHLTNLNDDWSAESITSIKSHLRSLIPYEFKEVFNIYLFESNTTIEEATILQNTNDFSYDYKIDFNCNDKGKVVIKIFRDEFDFKSSFNKVMDEAGFDKENIKYFQKIPKITETSFVDILKMRSIDENYSIGSFKGTLYFSKKQMPQDGMQKFFYKDITGRKSLFDLFGGIKIFRDSFRVRPYGEPNSVGSDWLMLAQRRNKSPSGVADDDGAWKVSFEQMHGNIYISRENTKLKDQSNRQGIIENAAFKQLKDFLINLIDLFEQDRKFVARTLHKYYEKLNPNASIKKEIKKLSKKSETEKSQITFDGNKVTALVEEKDSTIRQLENELQLIRALATTGIITNTYIHEMKAVTNKLSLKVSMAKDALEEDNDVLDAIKYLTEAIKFKNFFTSWFNITIDSIQRDKRTRKTIILHDLLKPLITSWQTALQTVTFQYTNKDEEISLKCFPFEIESIINNLIANSSASFEANPIKERQINVAIESEFKSIKIIYSDNGYGLDKIYKNNPDQILEPFVTSKTTLNGELDGTGMGMWIIKKIVADYNGSIDLSKNLTQENGFYVTITLKK